MLWGRAGCTQLSSADVTRSSSYRRLRVVSVPVPQTEKRCEIESLSSGDLSPFLTHFTYLFQLLREFLVTLDSFPSICCVQLFWDAVRLK